MNEDRYLPARDRQPALVQSSDVEPLGVLTPNAILSTQRGRIKNATSFDLQIGERPDGTIVISPAPMLFREHHAKRGAHATKKIKTTARKRHG